MIILGSTGSIGTNALNLARKHNIKISALSCAKNYKILNKQIDEFKPKFVCIEDKNLKSFVNHDKVFCGKDGLLDMINECDDDIAINSIVGFAGLMPSYTLQKSGKKLALANKESLVAGGKFLDALAINPIDSEHFGLKFLLSCPHKIKELVITASGGAFYKTPLKALKNVTPSDALKHPNWDMGAKITIDSATMANKLFEVMEAFWLFGIKNINAIIEPNSIIHALVNFKDGSTTAHISKTDMILAIAHAIFEDKVPQILENVDLLKLKSIKFKKINLKKYPIFSLKDEVLKNPDLGVIINGANEIGVYAFLDKKCSFLDISKVIFNSLDKFTNIKTNNIEDVVFLDSEVRKFAKENLQKR